MIRECIDPFGAPEFLITGVARREWICSEIVRQSWYSVEAGEKIIRVKLVIPVTAMLSEMEKNSEFLSMARGKKN